ncbi:jacalin-related lectin 3-like [Phoenix dactylifera]|uniref:Jacalin-related lectin 3-like n=1 Tax=Phoenix dactylifera TaxID=42345 RepID=A0A8B8ZJV6_PHODC|nr:jacalin-related lectin 3-like [Phoenix dactylifera]XP_038987242.1 jacalin-related lectin 3-like [Phoenix dactylifera]
MSIINTSVPNNEILIKLGARGNLSLGVEKWDEVYHGRLRQILISHGDAINSIQVSYTDGSGRLVLAPRHGGYGEKFDCVDLESWETLTMVGGYYGPLRGNNAGIVRSLAFGTNGATYGPFGIEEGTPFRFNIPSGVRFWGFHGGSDSRYLHAIGIYIKSMARYYLAPKPERVSFSRSTRSVPWM